MLSMHRRVAVYVGGVSLILALGMGIGAYKVSYGSAIAAIQARGLAVARNAAEQAAAQGKMGNLADLAVGEALSKAGFQKSEMWRGSEKIGEGALAPMPLGSLGRSLRVEGVVWDWQVSGGALGLKSDLSHGEVRLVGEWALGGAEYMALSERAAWSALASACAVLVFGAISGRILARYLRRNKDFNREAVEAQIAMIEALGEAIAKRDSDTGGHNFRVAWIAGLIGERMGVEGRILQALIAGSFLHDVGKIGIPDAILLKPGRLVGEELEIMRTHVALGEEILSRIRWLRKAKDVVSGHHEKWDGSGYPRGLAGDEIPLLARIFAVADVFDALCSRRPYKEPMGFEDSMLIIRRDAGSHFDPKVVAEFEKIAQATYDTLAGSSDEQARALVGDVLMRHFGLDSVG